MWFFMPEIAEKSARIMVVTILSVRRRGRAVVVDRASDMRTSPVDLRFADFGFG
jgi:hypothetical protein